MDVQDRLPALLEQALRAGAIDADAARRALAAIAPLRDPAQRLAALRAVGLPHHVVSILAAQGATAPPGDGTPAPASHGSSGAYTPLPAGARGTAKFPSQASTQADAQQSHTTPPAGGATKAGSLLEGSMRFSASRLVGSRIGPFVVEAELGRGGMGVVLKAKHDDGRIVALKLMTDLGGSADAAKRFAREAAALHALDHEHVVRFAGASAGEPGVASGMPWLAMQFVEGGDLRKLLDEEELTQPEVARIVSEVAAGVSHAHRHGIIHRDLKPGNVLVRASDRRAVVTDFGLARSLEASRFTKTGSMVGTLSFMAPEQVVGKDVGPPADVWAIGAILYRALCGKDPFDEPSPMALAASICHGTFDPPRALRPDIARDLEATCLACLQQDPAKRPTASLLATSLRSRRPIGNAGGRGRGPIVAGVAAAVALVVGGAIAMRGSGPATDTTKAPVDASPAPAGITPAPTTAVEPRPGIAGTRPTPEVPAANALPPGPWPALEGEGWRLAWTLGSTPAARATPAALWEDGEGRVASPAEAARTNRAGALAVAFEGEASALPGGRVRVRYAQLERVLRLRVEEPGNFVSMADAPGGAIETDPTRPNAVSLLSANDCEATQLVVGAARWSGARLSCQARLVQPVDSDSLAVIIGKAPGQTPVQLSYGGRTGTVAALGKSVSARLGSTWRDLRFAPGAERNTRIMFGEAAVVLLDEALVDPAPAGAILFSASESYPGFADLEVEGRPEVTDLPALAFAPPELPTTAAIAALVRWEPGPCGGPRISIGVGHGGQSMARDGQAWSLAIDGARLVLLRGDEERAASPLPPDARAGWLRLERRADSITGRASFDGPGAGEPLTLERVDPLPLGGGPVVAGWGSNGPRATFERVDVLAGEDEPARADLDRAPTLELARERLEADAAGSAVAQWRLGALLLARSAHVPVLDRAFLAPEGLAGRQAQAAAAARALESAADRMAQDDARRGDALARAVLARVITGDGDAADRTARRLVDAVGATRARASLDPLEATSDGAPALVARLVKAYTNIRLVPVRDAALRAALVVAPDQEGEVCLGLATNVRFHEPKPDPRTAEGRRVLEGALALFKRARAAGVVPPKIDAYEADTTMDLERWDDALAIWDRVVVHTPAYWWGWLRRGQVLSAMGRPHDALESLLGALARAPTRPQVHREVMDAAQRVQGRPGLVAAALCAVADCVGPQGDGLKTQAEQLARQVPVDQDDRDSDLAVYVLARGGARPGGRAASDRPTSVLARARAGAPPALAALREIAAQDALVRHLALCDRTLDAQVR